MKGADLRQILSKNIKNLRVLRSLSQTELAEKADISIPFLSNIERSNKWPHPDTLVRIAKALNVEVYILFLENMPSLPKSTKSIITQFKKDISISIQKNVSEAINNSIEIISSRYIDENKK